MSRKPEGSAGLPAGNSERRETATAPAIKEGPRPVPPVASTGDGLSEQPAWARELRGKLERVESAILYTEATVAPGNLTRRQAGQRDPGPEWIFVHGGRADSSYRQLRGAAEDLRAIAQQLSPDDNLFKERTPAAAARQLATVLAFSAECHLATLEQLRERKSSTKADLARQDEICERLVQQCHELGIEPGQLGLMGHRCVRLDEALVAIRETQAVREPVRDRPQG